MISNDFSGAAKEKIKNLEDLPAILESHRSQNQKIVQSHGVFDLLHIGHIRHFEQAKKSGDILAVTLTPDEHVSKGPHRPAFPGPLRAEAIAALDCVDYVAINKWPLAVEAIRLLKPDFYAKGSDYKYAEEDRTGGIEKESVAVESVGGQVIFTEDITYSSSNLINKHMQIFSDEVKDYLRAFGEKYSSDDVVGYIESIQPMKVLVVGEAIIDEYQYCDSIGKSSKEPMLALRHSYTEKFGGGILAVANHVANFCDHVSVLSFLGEENSQAEFVRENLNENVEDIFLFKAQSPTIVKQRFIDQYFFTKLLEIYETDDRELNAVEDDKFCTLLNERLPDFDVVIVVDFGHGMMSETAIEILCEKARFLAVNAQSNAGNLGYHTISTYPRADFACMAENEIRLETRDRRGDLKEMIRRVSKTISGGRVAVTRGKFGSCCYSDEEGFNECPALAGQIVDRVGAGDTFLSLSAPCVARGVPMEIVNFIGNVVGGQAVATVGNRSSVQRIPMFKNIESLLK